MGNEQAGRHPIPTSDAAQRPEEPFAAVMRRALELAAQGPDRGVNPQVGCVIVGANGTLIASGWHRGAGTPHAEVDALSQLTPGEARGATAVVTLEPCNHTGRTGPCVDALIAVGIGRVVFSVDDPGANSGGGAERLEAAGIEVVRGTLRSEGETLLGDWLHSARLGRPVVIAKWAQSVDGRTAAADGTSQWITGPEARADVHRRRAKTDAIAVGTGTLIADNPALTARSTDGDLLERQPIPVVFGHREVPSGAAVRRHPHPIIALDGDDLAADLASLHGRGIRSLFVEGGPTLISALIAAGLVDEYLIYLSPSLIGGARTAIGEIGVGTIAETRRLAIAELNRIGDDILIVARPKG